MKSAQNQNSVKLEGTFEKEPCTAPDKITVKLGYTYRWPGADLSLELIFQGPSGRSNSGSICLSVQMTDLIQKSREGLVKNHKVCPRIFRQWSIYTNFSLLPKLGNNPTNS